MTSSPRSHETIGRAQLAGENARPRVVVVEDSAELRVMLRHLLTRRGGCTVVAEAGDGRAGLEAVERHRPDVVVTDLEMPVMDGIELIRRLQVQQPQLPVVMLTGWSGAVERRAAYRAGAAAFVDKTTGLAGVLGALSQVLGQETGTALAPDAR